MRSGPRVSVHLGEEAGYPVQGASLRVLGAGLVRLKAYLALAVRQEPVKQPEVLATSQGGTSVDDQAFQNKFDELMQKLHELPDAERTRLEQLAQEAKNRRQRIRASVTELQESLDNLRLSVKYIVFDLEATRRENAYLRKLLEQANRDDAPRSDPSAEDFYDPDPSGSD